MRHSHNGKVKIVNIITSGKRQPEVRMVHNMDSTQVRNITDSVLNNTALACMDAAVKRNTLAYFAVLINTTNDFEYTFSDRINAWYDDDSTAGEARAILGLLQSYFNFCEPQMTGSIEILTDSRNYVTRLNQSLTASKAVKPCGEFWSAIKTYNNNIKISMSSSVG